MRLHVVTCGICIPASRCLRAGGSGEGSRVGFRLFGREDMETEAAVSGTLYDHSGFSVVVGGLLRELA